MSSLNIANASISENIRLSALQTDKFKAGAITFSISAPTSAKGVAFTTVICRLLKRGNEKLPSVSDVYKRLDELYSSTLDIRTAFNASELSIIISSELLDNAYAPCGTDILDGVIELVADSLLHPLHNRDAFLEQAVSREVETVRSALLAESNNTQAYSLIRCKELLNRRNSQYPTIETLISALDEITPESLWAFYKQIISYSPLDVFYVGGSKPSTVSDKLKKYFADFNPTKEISVAAPVPDASLPFAKRSEKMSVSQSKLVLGFHSGVSATVGDYHAAFVFNELWGCSPVSKLFMNVRERLGLCYYCASSYNAFSGIVIVSCGTDLSKIDAATEEIVAQLDAIRRGEISEAELSAAKKSIINAYRQIYDNPFDITNFYSNRLKFGIVESIEDCINAFERVEARDVIEIADSLVYDTAFILEGTGTGGDDTDEEELYE